jgi:MYXO-CTERM domain-containing protein
VRALALTLLLVTLPTLAQAGEVSPRLRSRARYIGTPGEVLRVAARLAEGPAGPRLLARLRAAGARTVELPLGGLAQVGPLLSLDVPRTKLDAVAAVPGVVRLDPAIPQLVERALHRTAVLAGAQQLWASRGLPEAALDGAGVIIADHEQDWDPFHPDFYRADGGLFDWIDSDGSGALSVRDQVVVDGRTSRLSLLEPFVIDTFGGGPLPDEPGVTPDLDWVYVDTNGNGVRDSGAGFAGRPAHGEPIFVLDDVDRSGRLEVGEKLVRLSTSKVVGIYDRGRLFRGDDITQYLPADGSHGTSATSVAVGGVPGLRRFTGMAPGASLALVAAEDPIEAISAADQLGASVQYWEQVSLVEAHDGSSALEQAVTESARRDTIQVTATGNIGNSGHNMRTALRAGRPRLVPWSTDAAGVSPAVVVMVLTWRGAPGEVAVTLAPAGQPPVTLALLGGMGSLELSGPQPLFVDAVAEQTSQGNAAILLSIASQDGNPIFPQEIMLGLTATRELPELRGLLVDDVSGWSTGAAWLDAQTDEGTAMAPSTADLSLVVGAYGGVNDLTAFGFGGIGEWRRYSGTGPRLDGARVVDVVGPDDPFAATLQGGYAGFSGTSGALPHVVGAAALLLQSGRRGFTTIESAITGSARTDAQLGMVPTPRVGFGKVSARAAILGSHIPAGAPPTLSVAVSSLGAAFRVSVEAVSGAVPISRIEWDEDYDLVYDRSTSLRTTDAQVFQAQGTRPRVVVRVVDINGQSVRQLVSLEAPECPPGACRAPNGSCVPCAMDAGIPSVDSGPAARPDARPQIPDGGVVPPLPDATVGPDAEAALDGATGRRILLETIPREDWTCGCSTGEPTSTPLTALALLGLLGLARRRKAG